MSDVWPGQKVESWPGTPAKETSTQPPVSFSDFMKGTLSGVLPAMGESLKGSYQAVKEGLFGPKGEQGVLGGTLKTGKALAAIPGAIPEAISAGIGALGSHPMAAAEHAIGSVIAPKIAAKDIPEEMTRKASKDIQTALLGISPAKGLTGTLGAKAAEALPVPPSEQQLRAAYKADYDISEKSGITFKPEAITDFKKNVFDSIEEGAIHDEILAPKAFKIFDKLNEERTTVPKIDNVRKLLGNLAGSPDKYERAASSHFIQQIDKFMEGVPKIKEARANYAARERSLLIAKAVKNAERKAQRQGSGWNIDNSLRQELSKIREKKPRGFTEEELATMDKIIKGTWTGDILRWMGNLMAPTDFMHLGAGGAIGFLAGGPAGAVATPITGAIAKKLADRITRGAIEKLSQQTRMRSPLAERENLVRQYLQKQGLQ